MPSKTEQKKPTKVETAKKDKKGGKSFLQCTKAKSVKLINFNSDLTTCEETFLTDCFL